MTEEYWFVQHNFKVGDDLVNVRGRDVQHLLQNVREYADVVGELAQLKANLQGAQSLGQMTAPAQQQALAQGSSFGGGDRGLNAPAPSQRQSQGWGAAQRQAPAPQQGGVQLHPEGKQCNCGATLQYKVVNRKSDGKQFKFWACPNQQRRDDGHDTEFAN